MLEDLSHAFVGLGGALEVLVGADLAADFFALDYAVELVSSRCFSLCL